MRNEILKLWDEGISLDKIGEQFGLTRVQVMQVAAGPVDVKAIMAQKNQDRILGSCSLTNRQARGIREDIIDRKLSVPAVMAKYGIHNRYTVLDIVTGRRYRKAGGPIRRMKLSVYPDQRPDPTIHRKLLRMWTEGATVSKISKVLNVRLAYVRQWAGYDLWEGND